MVWCVHYQAVHLDHFSAISSGGVHCCAAELGVPVKLSQPVIVLGIDKGEFSLGKGYSAGRFGAGFEGAARIEIGAGLFELDYPPSADVAGSLFTAEHRTVRAHHPDRKKAVIATDMIRIAYVVIRIAYVVIRIAYVVMRIVYHKILKNRT